jgi:putative ABC transport system permease protein
MDSLFGLSMNAIMVALLVLLAVCLSTVLLVFLRNRIIFLMGLRNIPRRTAQTVLIVVGLMLSTVIITAAFTTGDTVDYSIRKEAFDIMGHVDQVLEPENRDGVRSPQEVAGRRIPQEEYERFLEAYQKADVDGVDGVTGVLYEPVPVVNPKTRLSEPNVRFAGVDVRFADAFPDIVDASTGEVLSLRALEDDEVFVNESAADELDVSAGDEVEVYVRGDPHTYTVRAVVEDRILTGASGARSREGMAGPLEAVQGLFENPAVDFIAVSHRGGVSDALELDEPVRAELERLIEAERFNLALGDGKANAVETAEEIGNFMTTFFLLLGLFSIAAGVLLIVMIFVMLAAERKSEMGMARAVGTKRLHLIEMFMAEGAAYDLASAIVGVVLGVLVAFALAIGASAMFSSFFGAGFTPHVTPRTIVISYSLGVVLTFATVTFSSWRISNLNIVAAIRDVQDASTKRMGWRGLAFWAPAVAFGVLLFYAGLAGDAAFPFALGFSLVVGGLAVLLTHFGAPARPVYTGMGLVLLLFWGLTAGSRLQWLFGTLEGDIEMFFLSGVAMVTASTFVIIYNSDVFLAALGRVGGLLGSILPALRTAIAYPMANRFRTGMTLAMISLVIFALTMMSTMNLNYDRLFLNDEARGGWDVQVVENANNPISDLRGALIAAGSPAADEIRASGRVLLEGGPTEVRQGDGEFDTYPVRGVTDGFVGQGSIELEARAAGYKSDAEVWRALTTNRNVAVIDAFPTESGFGPSEFAVDGIDSDATVFDPVTIEVRSPVTGRTQEVEIIGVIAFASSSNFTGIFLPQAVFEEVYGPPELAVHYAALNHPGRAGEVAREIEAALLTAGVQADSLKEIAEENNALSRNFLYLMQAFMGLGLLVGIAAVGVIAFRTVVERRQQIGMLRAIGYKRGTVALSFLLESSFVTVVGVASGMLLALWLAYFLVTSDEFPRGGAQFQVPWSQLVVIAGLTLLASFAMTWIPARQAATIPVAEALRYE